MKTAFTGSITEPGKIRYDDPKLQALIQKFNPRKQTPFYMEFIEGQFMQADAVSVFKDDLVYILIPDMEKCDSRIMNTDDVSESDLLNRCKGFMERGIPLCDVSFDDREKAVLRAIGFASLKPVLVLEEHPAPVELIEKILTKSGIIFFYTAGKNEVRSWPVYKGSDIVTCAAKIHSDLARGFIKADVASYDDIMRVHNMEEARSKGLVKVVGREYIIQPADIIEIRYNV